jgi:7,8-dihydropterin-6-yl-methyl-4-(beta-D-ribofuranosyl)aminobenzene 5'-phosphate synthase
MALIIKVLLENRLGKGQDSLLQAKPGLSLLVEDETSRVLFDTGPDGTFLHNAQRMGVSLSDLTATVLSHGHYDHCGGVPWLPDNSRIICHPQIDSPATRRYLSQDATGKSKSCREKSTTPATAWSTAASRGDRRTTAWSGEITVAHPRAYGVSTGQSQDYIVDEGVLIYRSTRGLVIICGCGHRGLINTVRHCQKITGIQQIYAIIGGLHLRSAPPWQFVGLDSSCASRRSRR